MSSSLFRESNFKNVLENGNDDFKGGEYLEENSIELDKISY